MKTDIAQLLTWCVMCASLLIGCGAPATPPVENPTPAGSITEPKPPGGKIMFDCTPPDAQVTVDGKAVGTAAQLSGQGGLALPPGLHRIEISSPGHRPYRLELNLKEQTETIKIQLDAEPQEP